MSSPRHHRAPNGRRLRSPGTGTIPGLFTVLVLLAGLGLLAGACAGEPEEPSPPDAIYEARGEVVISPAPGSRSLLIRHESIPEFVSREGESVGMDSMTMPFSVAPSLTVDELGEGDAVDFEFEVRWEGDPMLRITRLEKLPEGTELDFSSLPDEDPGPTDAEEQEREAELEPQAEPETEPEADGTDP